jgi:hypothetical protein
MYVRLKLKDGTTEFYSFSVPVAAAKNLIIGKPYVDIFGKT